MFKTIICGKELILDDEDALRYVGRLITTSSRYFSVKDSDGKRYSPIHRDILGIKDGSPVDHINGNPYDNRRVNLRICTPSQNSANSARKDSNSGVRGVYFDKRRNRYLVQITKDNKTYTLGRVVDFNEAVRLRFEAEDRLFGEFSFRKSRTIEG